MFAYVAVRDQDIVVDGLLNKVLDIVDATVTLTPDGLYRITGTQLIWYEYTTWAWYGHFGPQLLPPKGWPTTLVKVERTLWDWILGRQRLEERPKFGAMVVDRRPISLVVSGGITATDDPGQIPAPSLW